MANHIYKQSHMTQINIKKIKSRSTISVAQNHNTREYQRLGGSNGDHIDKRRLRLNETITASLGSNIWYKSLSKITGVNIVDEKDVEEITKGGLHYEDGRKVRSDAVLALEVEVGYPGDLMWHKLNEKGEAVPVDPSETIDEVSIRAEDAGGKGYFLYPANMDEYNKWRNRTVQFLHDNFTKENVVSIEVHMDESKPHLHALVIPIINDDKNIARLNCKGLLLNAPDGNLMDYHQLQTAYSDRFKDMGYVRGEEHSMRKHYSDRDEMREIAARVLHSELPKDPKEAQDAYKSSLAKIAELELVVKTRDEQQKKVAELIKKNRELKEENARKEKEIQRMRQINSRRQCELKGMELHSDKETIDEIYKPLQESLIESGREWFEKELNIKFDRDKEFEEKEVDDADI